MGNIVINNNAVLEERLVLTDDAYANLKGRLAAGLLEFYDRVEFGEYREFTNSELLIRGYKDKWVAVNTFFVEQWYAMDAGEFEAAMEEYLSVKAHQYLATLC